MKKQSNINGRKTAVATKDAGAVNFEVNPFYENLLEMRERKPAAFRNLSPATRFAVEAYLEARRAQTAQPSIGERAA
ncbi:MAG TPA: hypothetical protein VGX92_17900 [Pyrinomonadaceae bacterium]|jgi:hypothetical protein|nr:hypothetical protein [Pyrinomonadaceae bacterium]